MSAAAAAAASFGPRAMSTHQRHHRLGSTAADDERWAMLKKSTFQDILNAILVQTNIQLPLQLTPPVPPPLPPPSSSSSSSSSSFSSSSSSSSSSSTTTITTSSSSSSSSSLAVERSVSKFVNEGEVHHPRLLSTGVAAFLQKTEDESTFARNSLTTTEISPSASSLFIKDSQVAERKTGEDPKEEKEEEEEEEEEEETRRTDSHGASRDRQPETPENRSSEDAASGNETSEDGRESGEPFGIFRSPSSSSSSSEHVLAKCSDCRRTDAETAAAAAAAAAASAVVLGSNPLTVRSFVSVSNTRAAAAAAVAAGHLYAKRGHRSDDAVDCMTSSLRHSGRGGVAIGNAPSDPPPPTRTNLVGVRPRTSKWIVMDKRVLFWIVERVLDGEFVGPIGGGVRIASSSSSSSSLSSSSSSSSSSSTANSSPLMLTMTKNVQRMNRLIDNYSYRSGGRRCPRRAALWHTRWPGGGSEGAADTPTAKCRATGSSGRDIRESLDIPEATVEANLGMAGCRCYNEAECANRSITESANYLRRNNSLLVTTTTTTTATTATTTATNRNSSESSQSSLNRLNRSPRSSDVIGCEECDVIANDRSRSSVKWKSEMITRLKDETRSRQSLADDENSRLLEPV